MPSANETSPQPEEATFPNPFFRQSVTGILHANIVLLIGGALWWTCHYALLWNPLIAQEYRSLAAGASGYDMRFVLTLLGTVIALVTIALATRRNPRFCFAGWSASYPLYATSTIAALSMMAAPLVVDAPLWLGSTGAVLSGIGNSFGLLFYGELHARLGHRPEPLAFALEMAMGIVLSVALSQLPIAAEVVIASVAAVVASALFAIYVHRQCEPETSEDSLPVAIDIRMDQLLILTVLAGFTYGLMRTLIAGVGGQAGPLPGLGPDSIGSLLGACLLAVVFVLQRRSSLFDLCLLFAVPLIAAGMLLASLQGVSAAVAVTVNTCGFACFFTLLWYFAALMASHRQTGSVSYHIALLLLVSQAGQLAGALIPQRFVTAFSSVLMYLILAATLFVFWRDRNRAVEKSAMGKNRTTAAGTTKETGDITGTGNPNQLNTGISIRLSTNIGEHVIQSSIASWERAYNLSARESQIALLPVQRTPYRQISSQLGVSENTVKTHVRNIYKKADVSSREELLEKLGGNR